MKQAVRIVVMAVPAVLLSGTAVNAETVAEPARAVVEPAGVVSTTSRAAMKSFADCPANRMCIWRGFNGEGPMWYFRVQARDLSKLKGGLNDHVYSVWNRTGRHWCLYEHASFQGKRWVIKRGAKGFVGAPARNQVSSLRPC